MSKRQDLTGQKFGRLTAINTAGKTKQGQSMWLCVCDCGNQTVVRIGSLNNGQTQSCGCFKKDRSSESHKLKNLEGKKFNRLTFVKFVEIRKQKSRWLVRCDCGNESVKNASAVKNGYVKSCGCLDKEVVTERNTTHSKSRTPEYRNWIAMKTRCNNPKAINYEYYGGKGVKVCKQWSKSFECFLSDMGKRPSPKHTIDRIDPFGNYEPSNCRWATYKTQAKNKRKSESNTD